MMQYPISAGAMLYAVFLRGHNGIYGVKNVLAGLKKEAVPAYFREMELELMESGLAVMDFDGGFSLNPDFAELVDACACCSNVLAVPSRRNGKETMLTCYLGENGIRALETVGAEEYLLHTSVDPAQIIPAFLGLPEGEGNLEQASVDSALIQRRDVKGLMEAGCSEALAMLAVNAAKGIDGYAQILRIADSAGTDLVTLLYNDAGTVSVDVEYPWGQELFRLTPVTVPWVTDRIRALLEA